MATENETIGVIDREITFLVRLAESARRKSGTLERSAYLLLGELDARGSLGIGALAETFRMDISTASRQVAALAEKGLVERSADPNDARVCLLEITPLGRAQLHATRQAWYVEYAAFLADWSEGDRRQFGHLLTRFNQAIVRRGKQ